MVQGFSDVIGWFYFDGCVCADEPFLFSSERFQWLSKGYDSENHISLDMGIYNLASPKDSCLHLISFKSL